MPGPWKVDLILALLGSTMVLGSFCPNPPCPCPVPTCTMHPPPTLATLTWTRPSLPRFRASAPGILWSCILKGPRKIQNTWEPTGTEVTMQNSQPDFGGPARALLWGVGELSWSNKQSKPAPPSRQRGGGLQDHWGLRSAHWVGDYSQHSQYPGSISIYGSMTPFQQIMTFRSKFGFKLTQRRGKG